MKIKLIFTCMLALTLCACMGKKTDTTAKARKEHVSPKDAAKKADFHKAALLNIEMGQTYLAQGQVTRAKQKFVHALELKPKLPEAHSAIGYFYETVGDVEEAEKHHTRAINYGAGKGNYYNNYGTFLCRQKRYNEADRAFNNALKDKQAIKTAEVYQNAGLCALNHDQAKAYSYLKTAVKNDPRCALANLELANIELNLNPKLALQYLNAFKQNGQPTAKSLWIGIQAYQKLGKQNELASSMLQLRSLFPDSDEYKELLGSLRHE